MKKLLKNKSMFLGLSLFIILGSFAVLFYDAFYGGRFRSTQDKIYSLQQVDLRGLHELQASGGSAVRFADLKRKLKHKKGPLIIVDGMAEDHGYIKGILTTFFGYQREGRPSLKHLIRRIIMTGTTQMRPELMISERQEAQKYGFLYKKVYIGKQFIAIDENIDEIIKFYDQVPKNAWLHFHCKNGRGRTTTLMVMLDILRNAPTVSLNDIVKRHHLLGSEDLYNIVIWEDGTYDEEKLMARKNFIEDFYKFICQRKAGGIPEWTKWKISRIKDM